MYDVLYDEDTYVPDYDEDNNYFDDGPWWDTTKMSNPDDTDLKWTPKVRQLKEVHFKKKCNFFCKNSCFYRTNVL